MPGTPRDDRASAQGVRFLASGALNTLATYALYCVLVAYLHPQVAYAIVFALGIALAYVLNSRFVFRSPIRVATATIYPLVYAAQYALNALLIDVLTNRGMGPRIALALALAVVTPVSFMLNRWVLASSASKRSR